MIPEEQSSLWPQSNVATGVLELFPEVWGAAEALCSPDPKLRLEGLKRLQEMGAPSLSPLIAYLVVSRLSDPDMELRSKSVRVVGELLVSSQDGNTIPDLVRRYVVASLHQMRTRNVYHLLEVAAANPDTAPHINRLLDSCPYAGRHLGDIALDRSSPYELRKQAVLFIGAVGYLDSVPALKRLESRLEARSNGQQAMSFAPPAQPHENDLLPFVKSVLEILETY